MTSQNAGAPLVGVPAFFICSIRRPRAGKSRRSPDCLPAGLRGPWRIEKRGIIMSFFVTSEGGLTTAGYFAVAICVFLLLIVISAIGNRKGRTVNARVLTFSAAAISLAYVCSFITVLKMPMGGSITLFSMLFVVLIGYWYGPAVGIMAGIAYGLLQLIQDPYIISIPQMLCDYIFAFGALGIGGFFRNRKYGLPVGYICAITGRFIFALLSGVIFFADYAPANMSPFVYSAAYNGAYIYAEGAITIILLLIPAVSKALSQVRTQAVS